MDSKEVVRGKQEGSQASMKALCVLHGTKQHLAMLPVRISTVPVTGHQRLHIVMQATAAIAIYVYN